MLWFLRFCFTSIHLPHLDELSLFRMSDQGDTSVQKKLCRELPLERVVVFNDRAELKRKLQCELEPGVNEVHLEVCSRDA